jgi:hypothetical protein
MRERRCRWCSADASGAGVSQAALKTAGAAVGDEVDLSIARA